MPSPCLFILAAELLACKIRQDNEIQGINIFGKELKLSQFADDTTLLNNDCNSVNKAIAVLDNFGDISGLKLNPSKTKALWPAGIVETYTKQTLWISMARKTDSRAGHLYLL